MWTISIVNLMFYLVFINVPQVTRAAVQNRGRDAAYDIYSTNVTKEVEYCATVKPKAKDILIRFYTLFIFFDQYALNRDFVNRYRRLITDMSENAFLKNKHAAYMVTVLTPLVFLLDRDDTWCLVEKFERALRHYSAFDPTDSQDNLKHLHRVKGLQDQARVILKRLTLTRNSVSGADTFMEINNSLI